MTKYNRLRLTLSIALIPILILAWLSHQDGTETVRQSYVIIDRLAVYGIFIEYQFFRDLMHLLVFSVIACSIYIGLNHFAPPKASIIVITLTCIPLIALIDEFHQSFIPGRTPSLHDIVLDISGGSLGLMVGIMLSGFAYYILGRGVEAH